LWKEREGAEPAIVLDRSLFTEMLEYVRAVHGFTPKVENPGNEHTKQYLVDRDRKRAARQKDKGNPKSVLKPLIASMVNHQNFKYDYTTVWGIPMSALIESVHRIQKIMHYLQTMQGVYAGTVKFDSINKAELDWLR